MQKGDFRKALHPNYDLIKPKPAGVFISKEHVLSDFEIDKLYQQVVGPGPTSHNPEYKLTEKRADIGVPKIVKPSKVEKEEIDERSALFPNVDSILPNHSMTFKYYEPSNVGPKHTPEKVKNPGQWKYYDIDLDVVRE